MPVEWKETCLSKQTLRPGQSWTYRLPVRVQGAAPVVQWNCDLLPPSAIEVDDTDPLRLTVRVPPDARAAFGEITYQIQDADGPVCGRILIRVQATSASDQGVARAAASERLDGAPQPISPGEALQAGAADARSTRAKATARREATAATSATATQGHPEASAASTREVRGAFCVDVVRNGVSVPGLKVVLAPERTIRIGKSSGAHGIPDIDLRRQFETPELETACSRRQAEVFWSEGRIWIKTVGKHPLKFVNSLGNPGGDVPAVHCWQPNQVLIIPGKLRLVLRQERNE